MGLFRKTTVLKGTNVNRNNSYFVFYAVIFLLLNLMILMSACNSNSKNIEEKKPLKKASSEKNKKQKKVVKKTKKEKPVKVKGLYLTGWNAGLDDKLQHFIDIVKKTEINSVVLDIKDDDGYIGYKTNIPIVKEFGGWQEKYNPEKVIKKLHKNKVHVIGRVVCFKDPVLSRKRPDLAIKDVNGNLFYAKGITWLDPYNKDSWQIIIDTAKEGVKLGFDEIQFDYIRFSNDGNRDSMAFDTGGKERYEIINEFLAFARKQMPDVILSADVFGIICESPQDTEKIGQYLETIGKDSIDYISPMVYPSHYRNGQKINKIEFLKPDKAPYEVVYNTLVKAKERIEKVKGYRAKMRPYLQDFTATWLGVENYKTYSAEDVRAQINAVYHAGYDEWILWNASNRYSELALLDEDKVETVTAKPIKTPASTKVLLKTDNTNKQKENKSKKLEKLEKSSSKNTSKPKK